MRKRVKNKKANCEEFGVVFGLRFVDVLEELSDVCEVFK
jgi:hypothetical protein